MAQEPIIKIIRPRLTDRERAARMQEIKKALIDFCIEAEKAKQRAKEESA